MREYRSATDSRMSHPTRTQMNPNSRIFVAGHRGLVGSAILRRLRALGFENLALRTHAELDLEDNAAGGKGRLPDAAMRKKMEEFWGTVSG